MLCYKINQQLETIDYSTDTNLMIYVLSKKEATEKASELKLLDRENFYEQSLRFCKAEESKGWIIGSFYIPSKKDKKNPIAFVYMLNKEKIVFIDDSGFVNEKLKIIADNETWDQPSTGLFWADFLDTLIEKDAIYITELESQMNSIEEEILHNAFNKNFNNTMSLIRKKLMLFSNYYLQLAELGSVFLEDDNHFFDAQSIRMFELFVDRVNRLKEEIKMLRDFSMEIRDVYQSTLDMRQNEIMKILTIVTTIFMPLSLIAAWYGMNFKYMPELVWEYGYIVIIVISIVTLVLCVWMMKKKKFW